MMTVGRALGVDQGGAVTVLVAGVLLALVATAGLVTDGGAVLVQRRGLQGVADAAALAGAMQLDEATYRSSGGRTVWLDRARARAAASGLAAAGGLAHEVVATRYRVQVSVSRPATTIFLAALGFREVLITARAEAVPRYGTAGGP